MNGSRDRATGRYTYDDMTRPCVCGHPLGWHTAACVDGRRDCLAADQVGGEPCDCERFRPSRRKSDAKRVTSEPLPVTHDREPLP